MHIQIQVIGQSCSKGHLDFFFNPSSNIAKITSNVTYEWESILASHNIKYKHFLRPHMATLAQAFQKIHDKSIKAILCDNYFINHQPSSLLSYLIQFKGQIRSRRLVFWKTIVGWNWWNWSRRDKMKACHEKVWCEWMDGSSDRNRTLTMVLLDLHLRQWMNEMTDEWNKQWLRANKMTYQKKEGRL